MIRLTRQRGQILGSTIRILRCDSAFTYTTCVQFSVILVSANLACEELMKYRSRAMWACRLPCTFKSEPMESDLEILSGPRESLKQQFYELSIAICSPSY